MTKNLLIALSVIFLATGSGVALAHAEETTAEVTAAKAKAQSAREQNKAALDAAKASREALKKARAGETAERQLKTTQTFGDQAITARVKALASISERTLKSCNTADATVAKAALDTFSTQLTTNQTELKAASDAEAARSLVKGSLDTTKVFAVLIPATRGYCLTSRQLSETVVKIQTVLDKVKTAGIDTAAMQTSLDTAKTELTAAQAIYKTLMQNPALADAKAQFTTAKTHLTSARTSLHDLKDALADVKADFLKKRGTTGATTSTSETETNSTNAEASTKTTE